MERSPYTRVLPPSAEKGIWAAQEPAPAPAAILGVALPVPEKATRDDVLLTTACASTLGSAVQRAYEPEVYRALSDEVRRCLAARLYEACVRHLIEKGGSESRKEPIARALQSPARAALPRVERFRDDACYGAHLPATVTVNRILGKWLPP